MFWEDDALDPATYQWPGIGGPPIVSVAPDVQLTQQPPPGTATIGELEAILRNQGVTLNDRSDIDAVLQGRQSMDEFNRRAVERGQSHTGGVSSSANTGSSSWTSPQFIQPFTEQFSAPTMEQAQQSPGFKFRLGEAMKAIERSGLAKGTYFTNQTARALQEQAGNLASAEYDKLYGRSLGEYLTRADIHRANEEGRFGSQLSGQQFGLSRELGLGRLGLEREASQRAGEQDVWQRGLDVAGLNRAQAQDYWNQLQSITDLQQRYRPRPA